jgi:hypothetical protein
VTYGTFLGGSGSDLGWALAVDQDGFVYLTGETKSADFPTTPSAFCDTMTGDYADIFVSKLRLESTPVEWETFSSGVVESYTLLQNWPNPFNAGTQIRYRIPQAGHVTLRIYNAVGQEVHCLVDEKQAAGEYIVFWNGRNDVDREVSSGVYFCRIEIEDVNGVFTDGVSTNGVCINRTLKMLLLR